MLSNEISRKLQDIVRGALLEEQSDHCTTIRNYLCKSFGTSPTVKGEFESRARIKKEQAEFLKNFARVSNLLLTALPQRCEYLTQGGESKVYLHSNSGRVFKVNDAIYYATWTEFFNSLVIHNLLFPATAYILTGFIVSEDSELSIVLEQPFIEGHQAGLSEIKEFLTHNGFRNIRRQDYYHDKFNLLLEDMHDENVLAQNDVLFFIDTVFYLL